MTPAPVAKARTVSGYEVFGWTEFRGLMDRLGIPANDLRTQTLTIRFERDRVVVTQEYLAASERG